MDSFIDIDGAAGYQCVDVFKQLCVDLGMKDGAKSIGGDGFAHQIWYRRKELGYIKYFIEVPKDQIKYGDVVVFSMGGETPLSHVGICVGYNSGKMLVFGQNQDGLTRPGIEGSAGNIKEVSTVSLLGGLRIKSPASVFMRAGKKSIKKIPMHKSILKEIKIKESPALLFESEVQESIPVTDFTQVDSASLVISFTLVVCLIKLISCRIINSRKKTHGYSDKIASLRKRLADRHSWSVRSWSGCIKRWRNK